MLESEKHYLKMTRTPVEKLILRLAIPTIISMLISNIYNLADTYFVGTLGVSASGAVGVVFTLMNILQAIGFMMGHGSGSVISRLLADRDVETASDYASTAFTLALGLGALIGVVGLCLLSPLMRLLGSTETILPYAKDYGMYILISAPMMIASLMLNNVLRYEGKAHYGMIGLSLGGILNMIGDPILIHLCGMGVDGAGLSTALSQTVSFVVLVILFRKHAQCRLSLRRFGSLSIVIDIVTTGFPNLFRQGLTSVSSGILNHCAGVYGDACVSAMAITSRCTMFMTSVALGICQGFQPVAGFNYQAKKYMRLRRAFRFTMFCTLVMLSVFALAGVLFTPSIVRLFQTDPQVLEIGDVALRLGSVGLIFTAFNMAPSMLLQTCAKKGPALLLACLRGGFCFIPLILLLPRLFGLFGVQLAQPVSDVVTALLSYPFAILFFRDLPQSDLPTEADSPM